MFKPSKQIMNYSNREIKKCFIKMFTEVSNKKKNEMNFLFHVFLWLKKHQ